MRCQEKLSHTFATLEFQSRFEKKSDKRLNQVKLAYTERIRFTVRLKLTFKGNCSFISQYK